jgi:N6-L-threonylcarbamoyladenine synthase
MIVLGIETSCDETAASVVKDGHILLSNVVASSMDLHTVYGGVVPEIAARSHIESILPVIDEALRLALHAISHDPLAVGQTLAKDDDRCSCNGHIDNGQYIANRQLLMANSSDPWDLIDAIAVTHGAGLGGSLLVGVMTARTLAIAKNKPLYAVNHVHGHVAANFLTEVGELASMQVSEQKIAAHNVKMVNGKSMANGKWQMVNYALPHQQPDFPLLALIVSGGHTQLVLFRSMFDYTR